MHRWIWRACGWQKSVASRNHEPRTLESLSVKLSWKYFVPLNWIRPLSCIKLEDLLLYFVQSTKCRQKNGGFWWKMTPFPWLLVPKFMVIATEQGSIVSRPQFLSPPPGFYKNISSFCNESLLFNNFSPRILIKFIISNESCSVPPEFRVDPYRCEESGLKDIGTDWLTYVLKTIHFVLYGISLIYVYNTL
jgi:hypothetical protein